MQKWDIFIFILQMGYFILLGPTMSLSHSCYFQNGSGIKMVACGLQSSNAMTCGTIFRRWTGAFSDSLAFSVSCWRLRSVLSLF